MNNHSTSDVRGIQMVNANHRIESTEDALNSSNNEQLGQGGLSKYCAHRYKDCGRAKLTLKEHKDVEDNLVELVIVNKIFPEAKEDDGALAGPSADQVVESN